MIAKSIAVALAGLTALAALPASANQGFEVVNGNEKASIVQLWYAQNGKPNDPWKSVQLTPIGPRTTSSFTFDGQACYQDIKVRFDDTYEHVYANVNVCGGGSLYVD